MSDTTDVYDALLKDQLKAVMGEPPIDHYWIVRWIQELTELARGQARQIEQLEDKLEKIRQSNHLWDGEMD